MEQTKLTLLARNPEHGSKRKQRVKTRALDVHEETVGLLHESFQLVLLVLVVGGGIQEVVVDRHGGLRKYQE